MSFKTLNPVNGTTIQSYQYCTFEEAQIKLEKLYFHFKKWRRLSIEDRCARLNLIRDNLKLNAESLAELTHQEMGKSKLEALAEINKSLSVFDYYASNAKRILEIKNVDSKYDEAQIRYEAMGVIFTIMPWNFPVWQVIRFAVPALIAGNLVLLKHSDITAGVAIMLEKIFSSGAHSPEENILLNVHVNHDVAEQLINDIRIQGVTFTGSEQGGRKVGALAGSALKKAVLELGGLDAYFVFEDADLNNAAKSLVSSRFLNCGQSCVAAKRWFVHESIFEKFEKIIIENLRKLELPPLAHSRFQITVQKQVDSLLSCGGRLVTGGSIPLGEGAFYPATLVSFTNYVSQVNAEEIFGPVAVVVQFKDEGDAVDFANMSRLALGGGVFTSDPERAQRVMQALDVGIVVSNDFVKSEAGLPFGGIKNSGYGRELGEQGLLEFVYTKVLGTKKR